MFDADRYLSKSQVDIVRLTAAGALDLSDRIVLQGAHGEEIVRSVLINDTVSARNRTKSVTYADPVQDNVIYTAGEDGKIQAFRSDGALQNMPKTSSKSKKKEGRFKPY